MLKRVLAGAASALVLLLVVLVGRAVTLRVDAPAPLAVPDLALDADAAAARLAGALRFRTVSRDEPVAGIDAEHAALGDYLRSSFPRVFAALEHEAINAHSHLLRWPGSDPRAAPVLFAAHLDVVPVESGTESQWTHPAFDGVIADGFVWGRGAMDDKSSALGLLEAVDALLARGFRPAGDVYLAFGHDEEIGGEAGAARIAARLRERGVRLEFVLDEGMVILDGVLPGTKRPIAVIGVAEKGYMTVQLDARGGGGHASLPGGDNPVVTLARALTRVAAMPAEAEITAPVRGLLQVLAAETGGVQRLALANLWLTEPLLARSLGSRPLTAAMVRDVVAPTRLVAGEKENAQPQRATAAVNVRLLTGRSIPAMVRKLETAIDDPAVRLSLRPGASEPSAVASTDSAAYRAIAGAVRAVFADTAVAPGLMIAMTDSKHYADLADDVYRFLPLRLDARDVARYHGNDERIAVAAYADMIRFYATLIAARG